MTALSYAAGYVLDFFRERVTASDFEGERVSRVLVAPGFDQAGMEAVRRLFPAAELHSLDPRSGVWSIRRLRADVACIPMSGGSVRARLVAMASGARHKLLIPSPDYVYRFGMRRGLPRWCWAVVDRFLLAPLALIWLLLVAGWMYAGGAVGRSVAAERSGASTSPRGSR